MDVSSCLFNCGELTNPITRAEGVCTHEAFLDNTKTKYNINQSQPPSRFATVHKIRHDDLTNSGIIGCAEVLGCRLKTKLENANMPCSQRRLGAHTVKITRRFGPRAACAARSPGIKQNANEADREFHDCRCKLAACKRQELLRISTILIFIGRGDFDVFVRFQNTVRAETNARHHPCSRQFCLLVCVVAL